MIIIYQDFLGRRYWQMRQTPKPIILKNCCCLGEALNWFIQLKTSLCSVLPLIRSEYGKMRTRKNFLNSFHAVLPEAYSLLQHSPVEPHLRWKVLQKYFKVFCR